MSMCYVMKQASDSCIDMLKRNPELAMPFICGEEATANRRNQAKQGFIGRFFSRRSANVDERLDTALPKECQEDCNAQDLDKSWHGVHFLLTRTEWDAPLPEGFLLYSGEILECSDQGYGDASACSACEVMEFAKYLEDVDESELGRRYDPKRMQELEIYPCHWDRPEELAYLLEYYHIMREFVKMTSQARLGLVWWLE